MSFFLDTLLASAGNEAFDDQVDPIVPVVDVPAVDIPAVPAELPPVVDLAAPVVDVPVVAELPVVEVPVVEAPVVSEIPAVVEAPVVVTEVQPDPVDVAAVNAAAILVAEAEADLSIAQGANTIAVLDGELAAQEREIGEAVTVVDHIQEVSTGIEHFMEVGHISASTAMLLQQSVNSVMRKLGKDGRDTMAGGLETFGNNPDQAMIVLGAGLLELEEEKKSLGSKVMTAIKAIVKTIGSFIDHVFSQTKKVREKVGELAKTIKGKPEREVKITAPELLIGKAYSTNLAGDLDKFKVAMVKNTIDAITSRSNWYFKTAPQWINKICEAGTADEAVGYVKKLTVPALKNASTSVRDEDGMTLKRTEVTLGNYAIFELAVKAGSPSDAASAVAYLKAAGKSRINIQRAKIEAPEAETLMMNETTAAKILGTVSNLLNELDSLKPAIDALVKQNIEFKAVTTEDADAKKIAKEALNMPMGLVDTVSQLPRTAARATVDVANAALAVVSSFAKVAKAEKTDDADAGADAGDAEAVPA